MNWYKIILSSDQTAESIKLEETFDKIFYATAAPKDMALFSNKETKDDFIYYFSPSAVKFAKSLIDQFSGLPCDPPKSEDCILSVGHADAKERLLS